MSQDARGKLAIGDASTVAIAPTPQELRTMVGGWRRVGLSVALVPTMGALHEGHLALVARARAIADRVVVSIFVNPTQFAPTEDLARYPRTFEQDCAMLSAAEADVVYAPTALDMYPDGLCTSVQLAGPAKVGLEDAVRPHFFAGVATVVAKLLLQCLPDAAIFGEKDYQQLRVVNRMVQDLDIPVQIIGVPTVRENDGLAMSSRNRFLSAGDREKAAALSRALDSTAAAIREGTPLEMALAIGRDLLVSSGAVLDYFDVRDPGTLERVESWSPARPLRLLVAARLGDTRLIDNVAV